MRVNSLNAQILKIALPAIVSNITVPLLGMVDTAIAGHLGNASYIGAIAVGGVIFNLIYWLFVFLRMGTSGLTAQSFGARNNKEVSNTLYRAILLAIVVGSVLIMLQRPLYGVASRIMSASADVMLGTATYFYICIWGAVAVLLTYVLNGWFVGMQNSRIPMIIAILQNTINIPLSLFLVFGLDMRIAGVALGTVLAQYLGLILAFVMLINSYKEFLVRPCWREIIFRPALVRFANVNRDIMLRMVCLLAVTVWFTVAGVRQGDVILAANAILLQLFYLFSYFSDGFANAAEAMCGKYWGACDLKNFNQTVRRIFGIGVGLVLLFTLVYAFGRGFLLSIMTDEPTVRAAVDRYYLWLMMVPVCGIMAFVWDGVVIGITATRALLLSMFVGAVVFFALYFLLVPGFHNDGLWISFLSYLLMRGLVLHFFRPTINRMNCRA